MRKVVTYNHIGLVTENLEKIIDFYCGLLGFKVAAKFRADDEDSRKTLNLPGMSQDIVMLENEDGSVAMELLYYITPKASSTARPSDFAFNDVGVKHFSVSVDDIGEIYQKLSQYDGKSVSEPISHSEGFTFMLVRDPDGNYCEVRQYN